MHNKIIALPIPDQFTVDSINKATTSWRRHLMDSYPNGVPVGMKTQLSFCRLGQRQIRELREYVGENPSPSDSGDLSMPSHTIEILESEQENCFEAGDKD